ncbi:MAG: hypothetical protein ABI036_18665 [Fibrobacteria bacterium]
MTNKLGLHILAFAYGLTVCACSFNVVAPPARLAFAESPKVTKAGKTKYSAEWMGGGKIIGPEIQAATLRVSKGLSENREVNFRPIIGMVNKDNRLHQNNTFYGMALDLKNQVNPSEDWWAASFWGGGGFLYSSFGDIYSGHGGFAIGEESHWIRPFISTDIFIDIPARTKPILGHNEESVLVKRLTTTVGVKAAVGLKLQFIPNLALVSAASLGTASSKTDNIGYFLIGQSFELEF